MKRYIYFVLFATVFCQTSITFADFFMPASELEPRYEKLPPVPNAGAYKARQHNYPSNHVRRYIPVDGRFIPVVEETPPAADLTEQEPPAAEPIAETVEVAENPITPAESPSQEEIFYAAMPPQANPIDLSLPSYKNRYAQYLESLTALQYNGELPPNPELDATLSKLNSNDYVVVYKETLR